MNGKLYVSESANNRVLRFAWPVTTNQPTAELVFGQPDFVSGTANNGGRSATSLNYPFDVAVDSASRLWVSDYSNRRVLRYDGAASATINGTSASAVLGQANFAASVFASVDQFTLRSPEGLSVDTSGTLWVVDSTSNRVVRWNNAAAKANGAAMDGVLGQGSLFTNAAGSDAASVFGPYDVCAANGTLWVADGGHSRVLRFDNYAAKANGASADGVVGQANFADSAYACTATGMRNPTGVAQDGDGRLYVTDSAASRVTVFNNAASLANGPPANSVLGQATFTAGSSSNTAVNLNGPFSVAVDNTSGRVAVADGSNNRVVIYQASTPLPVAVSTVGVE